MSTLTDVLRSEGTTLASKGQQFRTSVNESTDQIIETAEMISENVEIYGDKAKELFRKCEEQMKQLVEANALSKAQDAALNSIHTRVSADASPDDVRKAFLSAAAETTQHRNEESFEPLTKLRKIMHDAGVTSARAGSSGAGPSGAGANDDDELDDEGMVMTQAQRSTRCPLLQVEMTATGELRPVKAPCGHCFSFKGISSLLKNKSSISCPQSGCKAPAFSMKQVSLFALSSPLCWYQPTYIPAACSAPARAPAPPPTLPASALTCSSWTTRRWPSRSRKPPSDSDIRARWSRLALRSVDDHDGRVMDSWSGRGG